MIVNNEAWTLSCYTCGEELHKSSCKEALDHAATHGKQNAYGTTLAVCEGCDCTLMVSFFAPIAESLEQAGWTTTEQGERCPDCK